MTRGNADFLDAGDEPFELSDAQRDCAEFKQDGSLRIYGVPGSGKTTVLLARASWLASRAPDEKVLVLSYNKALARYMRALAAKAGTGSGDQIQLTHFHEWASHLLAEIGTPLLRWGSKDDLENAVKYALNTVRKQNEHVKLPSFRKDKWEFGRLAKFLGDEFAWIKGQAIRSLDEYLEVERTGRGSAPRIDADIREGVWEVLEKYDQLLRAHYHIRDYDDVALLLLDNAAKVGRSTRPVHVLVDEGQDLTAAQYKAIVALEPKTLTIAADKGQKIYRRPFSWRSVGVDVRGGRTKGLPETYRSTREIIELAQSLLANDEALRRDDEYITDAIPTTEGTLPELVSSSSRKDEVATVLAVISRLRAAKPRHTIAVLARDNHRLQEFADALDNVGIPRVTVSQEGADLLSPGVKLVTYHSAKGLEFHHVICTGLAEGILPRKPRPGDDAQESYSTERRVLYVGMTRARLTLTLSSVEPASRFVGELDRNRYIELL